MWLYGNMINAGQIDAALFCAGTRP